MAYIYQAGIYCDFCGETICDELTIEGHAPDDFAGESTYDSDEYPKQISDDEESDSPQNCGNGKHCLKAEVLPSGRKIGKQMSQLTPAGVKYLKRAIARGGEIAEFWAEHYEAYLQ